MPDVPFPPEPVPTKAEVARQRASTTVRVALTGDPDGRVRRKILFLLAGVGSVSAIAIDGQKGDILGLILGVAGVVALLLLAMTDDVVPL
jgi:hypothetical protein